MLRDNKVTEGTAKDGCRVGAPIYVDKSVFEGMRV
jgi:hypothetical protein